jgi:hypothetical protein
MDELAALGNGIAAIDVEIGHSARTRGAGASASRMSWCSIAAPERGCAARRDRSAKQGRSRASGGLAGWQVMPPGSPAIRRGVATVTRRGDHDPDQAAAPPLELGGFLLGADALELALVDHARSGESGAALPQHGQPGAPPLQP